MPSYFTVQNRKSGLTPHFLIFQPAKQLNSSKNFRALFFDSKKALKHRRMLVFKAE